MSIPVIEAVVAMSGQDPASVFEQYGCGLKSFIRRRVPTEEDAEDILQDVLYQLVKADNLMNPIEQITAWLYRVARNKIINWTSKKREVLLNPPPDTVFEDFADILFSKASPSATPETEYLRSLVWEELDAALDELPQEQRDVFEKSELYGMTLKEISQETGVPVNTLKSRKHYAVSHLRVRLKSLYEEIIGQ